MNKKENQWDILSTFFDVRKVNGKVQGGAMDNILVACPPIIKFINKYYTSKKEKKVLDFGCGVGEFCYKLHELGFDVTGIDSSKSMISKARGILPEIVKTIIGDVNDINQKTQFDLITSIQVFQFIENFTEFIKKLDKHLRQDGPIIFAVFNIDFVRNCIKENILLMDFDSGNRPQKGFFVLGDKIRIPVYIRTAEEYKKTFKDLGYKCILEEYPPFTKAFLEKYPLQVSKTQVAPSKDPEFMIMGFKKSII